MSPFLSADVAHQWQIELAQQYWARAICFLYNASAIRSLVLAYLQDDWFFPRRFPRIFRYRLASKVGLDFAVPDLRVRQTIAESNPEELAPWI